MLFLFELPQVGIFPLSRLNFVYLYFIWSNISKHVDNVYFFKLYLLSINNELKILVYHFGAFRISYK